MVGKLRHRPKIFMRSSRLNSTVLESKSYDQKRSLNLSCSPDTIQCSVHIFGSRSPNELILFFGGKLRQIDTTFMKTLCQNLIVSMSFPYLNHQVHFVIS
jgi:hypothetical protein